MDFIQVTRENLAKEHICCAISNDKDPQVASKKAWLNDRFDDGLVFIKGNVRGKCFIEYLPAENAWAPIEADGYLDTKCVELDTLIAKKQQFLTELETYKKSLIYEYVTGKKEV